MQYAKERNDKMGLRRALRARSLISSSTDTAASGQLLKFETQTGKEGQEQDAEVSQEANL